MDVVREFAAGVARRLGLQALLDALAAALSAGLGAATVLVAAERLLSLGLDVGLLVAAPLLVACLAGAAAGLSRWPGLEAAALRADARLALQERLSSALAGGRGPMAELVRADAARHVAAIGLRERFPIRQPRWLRALALLAMALAASALMPQMDVLGLGAARVARARSRAALRHATDAARLAIAGLSSAARDEGLDKAAQALERADDALRRATSGASTADAQGAARKVLDDLAEARAAAEAAAKPDEREKAQRERDLLVDGARTVERWQRDLGADASGAMQANIGAGAKKEEDEKGKGRGPAEFVRASEPAPIPKEAIELEGRLLAARPGADAAMAHDEVPWPYRAAVRRYFSPDALDARAER